MLASSRHNTGFLILLFNLGGCNIALNRLSWLCDKTEIPDFDNEVYCVGLFSNTYHSLTACMQMQGLRESLSATCKNRYNT